MTPAENRRARDARWWAKLRSDPQRWAKRMEDQRKKRECEEFRERERQKAREQWAKMPPDAPRKRRKCRAKKESRKAKRQRDMEKLPDAVVANQYLHLNVGECPKELIEIKRQHIRLTRALGTKIKTA
jgi:hypothetical protein